MSAGNPHVLMLLENNPYPQDIRVRREAVTLVEARYNVSVIAPRGSGQRWSETVDGVHVHRFPAPPEGTGVLGYLVEYGWALCAIFLLSLWVWARRGADILHLHNPPDLLVLVTLPYKLFGKQVVFDHHDLAPEMYTALFGKEGGTLHRALLGFERLACRIADHVIVTNESYRVMDQQRNRVPATALTIVRNGPDPRYLKPTAPDPTLRRPGQLTLCYVGEMGFHDGVDYLLRAMHELLFALERTDLHLLLVGGGSAQPAMRQLATDLALTPHLTFTGQVPHHDVLRYIASADLCVAPEPANDYNNRSTVIKILEYMAVGKPIVAFDLPEHRRSAGDAALYATPSQEADFARQIVRLMDDPTLRKELGTIGRQRVEDQLAWPHQAQKLLQAYSSLHRLSLAEQPVQEQPVSEQPVKEQTGPLGRHL